MDWKFWIPTILAALQVLYAALNYHLGTVGQSEGSITVKRHYVVIGVLMLLTWAAVGFDYYDRRTNQGVAKAQMAAWGSVGGTEANATVYVAPEMERFKENNRLILIVRAQDPTIDINRDRVIDKSKFFDIRPGSSFTISVPLGTEAKERLSRIGGSIGLTLLMVPASVQWEEITSINDALVRGGKVLDMKGVA